MWFKRKAKLNNTPEALKLLEAELNKKRSMSYEELLNWLKNKHVETYEITASSGIEYQFEFDAHWDDKKNETIALWGSVDGGDITPYSPLTQTFIKGPDNKFIGG